MIRKIVKVNFSIWLFSKGYRSIFVTFSFIVMSKYKAAGCNTCGLVFNEENKILFPIETNKLKDGTLKQYYRKSRCKKCGFKRTFTDSKSQTVAKNRLYIKELKEKTPCTDCGKNYPHYVMQFDHLRDKKFHIGSNTHRNVSDFLLEIEKCEIVCANCHAERTHKRKDK